MKFLLSGKRFSLKLEYCTDKDFFNCALFVFLFFDFFIVGFFARKLKCLRLSGRALPFYDYFMTVFVPID